MAIRDLAALRDEAALYVARGRLDKALELYAELEVREPASPQWPKRLAETHRRLGQVTQAIAAFERAGDRFVQQGFLVQAFAMCKLILQIDPARSSAAQRLAALTAGAREEPAPPAAGQPAAPPAPRAPVARRPQAAPAPARAPTTPSPRPASAGVRAMPAARAPAPAPRPRPPMRKPPTLPPAAPLDVLELSTLVPRARKLERAGGGESGITLLPIDDLAIAIDLDGETVSGVDHDRDDVAELEWPTEVEVVEVAATPTEIELTQGARLALLATPLFAKLPTRALERLIARMAFVQLEPGDLVFREGDHGGTLYVISEGEVAVFTGDRELARLGPGAFFGEIALVTELPRSATVRAATRVEVLAIDRDVIREAIVAQPAIVDVLLGFVRDRLVDRVARTSALFQSFGDADRAALSARFELLEVVTGTPLLELGVRADGLYVLLAGRAEVTRDARHMASLGAGDVFGEISLLSGAGATATVTAASRVLALRMPAAVFREVAMTHPQVLAHLSELAYARTLAAGDHDSVDILDLHLDLV